MKKKTQYDRQIRFARDEILLRILSLIFSHQTKTVGGKKKNKSGVESYNLHWFDGEMVPKNLDDVFDTDPQEEDKGEGEGSS